MSAYKKLLRSISALLLTSVISMQTDAQGLQTGPDFFEAGLTLGQLNDGDALFDPYVLERRFPYVHDPAREGLIDLVLSVKADGTVGNVEVKAGFYDPTFLEDVMVGISEAKFKPAMAGDRTIEWPRLGIRVLLRGAHMPVISPALQADYDRILQLINDGDFSRAETEANKLLTGSVQFLAEMALVQELLSRVYLETDREHEALIALRLATGKSKAVLPANQSDTRVTRSLRDYPDHFLAPGPYFAALRRHVLTALALNQTGEALAQYDALKALAATREEEIADLDGVMAQLEAVLASEQPIGSAVKLVDGSWSFTISPRRTFGVTGLQGAVEFIDVNCGKATKRRMPFQNDTEFRIPDSWGECKLEFLGEQGSTFTLYEYLN